MFSRLWILMISVPLFFVSCKQQEAAQKKPVTDNAVPKKSAPLDRPKTDNKEEDEGDCEKNASDEKDEDEKKKDKKKKEDLELNFTGSNATSDTEGSSTKSLIERNSFGLMVSDPNYDDDISSILKDKCESCHAGSDKYAMDSYKKAKALRNKIKSEIDSGDMPPKDKSPLTSKEKTTIKNWVKAGAPENSDDLKDEEDREDQDKEDEEAKDSDCDDELKEKDKDKDDEKKGSASASDSDWDELLKKKEVEKCKDKGNIFDRLTETCHKAKIAAFSCDKAGIEAAFKKVNVDVSSDVKGFISDGYAVDQCGEFSNQPIVLFYKKETVKEEIKLLIKKLCKKGSLACDN